MSRLLNVIKNIIFITSSNDLIIIYACRWAHKKVTRYVNISYVPTREFNARLCDDVNKKVNFFVCPSRLVPRAHNFLPSSLFCSQSHHTCVGWGFANKKKPWSEIRFQNPGISWTISWVFLGNKKIQNGFDISDEGREGLFLLSSKYHLVFTDSFNAGGHYWVGRGEGLADEADTRLLSLSVCFAFGRKKFIVVLL